MNKFLPSICASLLCLFAYGCMSPNLSSLEKMAGEQRQMLLEKMHISDLCSYYLNPELQGETASMIADLLKIRGVQSCSSEGVDKLVLAR